jgi:hypothetical protein
MPIPSDPSPVVGRTDGEPPLPSPGLPRTSCGIPRGLRATRDGLGLVATWQSAKGLTVQSAPGSHRPDGLIASTSIQGVATALERRGRVRDSGDNRSSRATLPSEGLGVNFRKRGPIRGSRYPAHSLRISAGHTPHFNFTSPPQRGMVFPTDSLTRRYREQESDSDLSALSECDSRAE